MKETGAAVRSSSFLAFAVACSCAAIPALSLVVILREERFLIYFGADLSHFAASCGESMFLWF